MEVIVKTYGTPKEANQDAALMAQAGWYPQGTTGGGTGFAPIKGVAKGTLAGGALFLLSGGVVPPVAGFLGRKKWRTSEPITITWVRDGHSGGVSAGTKPGVAVGGESAQVDYDFHDWSTEDIDDVSTQVKRWCIPHRWDEAGKVLTVPAKYEEAMNKLVLGEA